VLFEYGGLELKRTTGLCYAVMLKNFSAIFIKNNINGIDWSMKDMYYRENPQILA
jgi:hypothetical protein